MPVATIVADLHCQPEDLLPALEEAAEGAVIITRVTKIPAATATKPTLTVAGCVPSIGRGWGMGFQFAGELRGHFEGTAIRLALTPKLLPRLTLWLAIPVGVIAWPATHAPGVFLACCALPLIVIADGKLSAQKLGRALKRQAEAAGAT